jgi:hypothetical protein
MDVLAAWAMKAFQIFLLQHVPPGSIVAQLFIMGGTHAQPSTSQVCPSGHPLAPHTSRAASLIPCTGPLPEGSETRTK